MKENLKKYLVEFIGTFFLVFTVLNMVYYGKGGIVAPLTIGFALMVCVYAGGHISGGHYNPAVSFAAAIRGALEWKELACYWLSQVIGGATAVGLMALFIEQYPQLMNVQISFINIFCGEFLFTFLLCYVVLLTATSKKVEGNSFYGFAIGSTVTVGAAVVGGMCYAAFNPAVAISLGMFNVAAWEVVILTILSNLIAGACAACVYKFVEK